MRISEFVVQGLFNTFNHRLPFDPNECITIITSPNGYGKTMILRIINAVFNLPVRSLERMPFKQLEILFEDNSKLEVHRLPRGRGPKRELSHVQLNFIYSPPSGSPKQFDPVEEISEEDINFPAQIIENYIPALDQISPTEWLQIDTGEILDLTDVLLEYGDRLPAGLEFQLSGGTPEWLKEVRQAIPVRLVGTERLVQAPAHDPRAIRRQRAQPRLHRIPTDRTVRHYSDQLADRIRIKLAEYATLSQSLDRTFPTRVVEEPNSPALSMDELRTRLRQVDDRRSSIVESGLLVQEDESRMPDIDALDDSRRGVLAVYAGDAMRKLSVFDDLHAKVNTFKRIANARLLYKQVSVSTNGLGVVSESGTEIDLEMLSSGEQHELVLLYDLLFGTAENSLIMIDEPELSLHVAWQDEILRDLEEIATLSNFHALLATHSPQVIGGRWDLTVELKGPYKG